MPYLDGTLSPLQIGLSVEKHEPGRNTAEETVSSLKKELKTSRLFRVRGELVVEETSLLDGTVAFLLSAKMDRLDKARLSFYYKLVCSNKDNGVVVVTGFLVCGRAAGHFVRESGLCQFLKAHVTSLVLDPERLDLEVLQKTYARHNWRIGSAIERTRAGNQHVFGDEFAAAAMAYSEALSICDAVSAAHNGLAWTLITSTDPEVFNLKEGLRHAEIAVEQTERRGAESLDTLALAYFKAGEKEKAVAAAKAALDLEPNNEGFKRKLAGYQRAQ